MRKRSVRSGQVEGRRNVLSVMEEMRMSINAIVPRGSDLRIPVLSGATPNSHECGIKKPARTRRTRKLVED